jgi:very-short-patch-repair endonuclease
MLYENIYDVTDEIKRKRALEEFAARNRENPTFAEEKMVRLILDAYHGGLIWCLPVRQYVVANNWILDLYFPDVKLGIEIDGDYHGAETQIVRDVKKELACTKLKIKLLRFRNSDVTHNSKQVTEKLIAAFAHFKKPSTKSSPQGPGKRKKRRSWPPKVGR